MPKTAQNSKVTVFDHAKPNLSPVRGRPVHLVHPAYGSDTALVPKTAKNAQRTVFDRAEPVSGTEGYSSLLPGLPCSRRRFSLVLKTAQNAQRTFTTTQSPYFERAGSASGREWSPARFQVRPAPRANLPVGAYALQESIFGYFQAKSMGRAELRSWGHPALGPPCPRSGSAHSCPKWPKMNSE